MGYGNTNSPGAAATVERNGLMSAEDKRDLEALKGLVPFTLMERTASGSPATFADGIAGDVKRLAVTLTPTQSGSGDPSPTNIRPISGASSATITRHGKNFLIIDDSKTNVNYRFTRQSDGSYLLNGTVTQTTFKELRPRGTFPLYLPAGDYILSGVENVPSGNDVSIYCYKVVNGQAVSDTEKYSSAKNDSTRDGVAFHSDGEYWSVNLTAKAGTYTNAPFFPMIRPASEPAGYERDFLQSVTVPLVDSNNAPLTVYGGTLDVTDGTLSVTWANIASYDGETLPGRWISDRDVYAAGTSPTTGAQVVYELAAPITHNLTAQQFAALSGYNAVSADVGMISVTYRANPSLAYEELMNAILSAGAGI